MRGQQLAGQIKKIRNEKGITQEKLARMAGLSVGHVIRLESRRKMNPTLDTLRKVSKALGISFEAFIGLDEKGGPDAA